MVYCSKDTYERTQSGDSNERFMEEKSSIFNIVNVKETILQTLAIFSSFLHPFGYLKVKIEI